MRHHARILFAVAILSAASSGCAARRLHRGSPAVTAVTAERTITAKAKPARKAKRDAPALPSDPLAAARARAQQEPSEPLWPYQAAQLEARAGHTAAAERSLRTAVERDSAYAPAITLLSLMLYEQGRHEEAVRLLAPVREGHVPLRSAERSAAMSGLALHEAALGRADAARDALARLDRDERDDAVGVAAWLAVQGRSAEDAARLTAAAVRAAPGSASNHNNRGIALLRGGDPTAAAAEFERAIALDPNRAGPYYNLAILERWYRLDTVAASRRFRQYWTRSHADPDSLYAELGHGTPAPVAEELPNR